MKRQSEGSMKVDIPDLQTQYEALLDTVWRCESRARLDDRMAARTRFEEVQSKQCSGKH